ncbi:glucoamylase family protein, partial [Dysgonomonas gadei]
NVLYWHWSPDYGWQMNLKITGWNESLIVYALAAASPTYPISAEVYKQGWVRNGAFANGKSYYGYTLPLGTEYGGPLFFSHYSFLGINPKDLKDQYTDYWTQNRNHTLINYTYCVTNPKGYGGYSADCWGLTASDGNNGYSAHSPTNDKGVIAPTAALSSMPYTPEESMRALHFFYYKLGDKLWSDYGFVDAFNLSEQWYDNQNIAIDQGPIVVMIENYRTGLLWSLFMADPEIKDGLKKLGFQSPDI